MHQNSIPAFLLLLAVNFPQSAEAQSTDTTNSSLGDSLPAESPASKNTFMQGTTLQQIYPSLTLTGFSDFNFSASDGEGAVSGFNEGQFILHFISVLAPKLSFYAELSLTARPDAGTGTPSATGFNAEVERTIIKFDQSDYFKISFGRYHTPINWWNTAFHHGLWLQTSVSRPEMVQFGGRFIPVHFVGGLIEGSFPGLGLNITYSLGIGNGRGSVISRGGDASDNNNNRAWLATLSVKPDQLFGLQIGGSIYNDKITLGGKDYREWITAGHAVWLREDPEIIIEFANVFHHDLGNGRTSNNQAFYIHVGYRLPWFEEVLKPYYRFESIKITPTDDVFQTLVGLKGSIVGIRYDIGEFVALKIEYRNQRFDGSGAVSSAFLQSAFTF